MGEVSRLDRLFLPMDTALSVSLFHSCNAAPSARSLPVAVVVVTPVTRSVTRERDKRQTGDLVADRRSRAIVRTTATALPPLRGVGGRDRQAEGQADGRTDEVRAVPHAACQGRRRLPGRNGAAAAVGDLRLLWYLGTVTHTRRGALSLSLSL